MAGIKRKGGTGGGIKSAGIKRRSSGASSPAPKKDDGGLTVGRVFSGAVDTLSPSVKGILNTLAIPGSAVVSTVNEINEFTEGRGFSPNNIRQNFNDRMGVGDIVENDEWGSTLPMNVKRAIGFIGDVGTDPTTFVTGGAAKITSKAGTEALEAGAKQGGRKAATRVSSKEVAEMAARRGMDDAAQRVKTKRTAAVLTPDEKAALGIETGLRWGIGGKSAHIPGTTNVGALHRWASNPALDAFGKSRAGKGVRRTFDTHKAFEGMRALPNGEAKVLQSKEAIRIGRVTDQAFSMKAQKNLSEVRKAHKGVDGPTMLRAIEVPGSVSDPRIVAAADDFAQFLETTRVQANEILPLDQQIGSLEDYVPHQMADEFRTYLDEVGKSGRGKGAAGQASMQRARSYKDGDKWLGHELETGSIAEMEMIAKQVLGDDYVQVFKNDPWQIGMAYLKQASSRVGKAKTVSKLEEYDLVRYFEGGDPKKVAGKLAKTKKRAESQHKAYVKAANRVAALEEDFELASVTWKAYNKAVKDNQKRLDDILARPGTSADEIEARQLVTEFVERAKNEADPDLAEVHRMNAVHQNAIATMHQKAKGVDAFENKIKRLGEQQVKANQMIEDGLRQHLLGNPNRWADPKTADLVQEVMEWNTPKNITAFGKLYDGTLSRWKAQALLSPGFHARNFYGAVFNNTLAGVKNTAYVRFEKAVVQMWGSGGDLSKIKDPEIRRIFEIMEDFPVFGGDDLRDLADIGMGTGRQGLVRRGARQTGGGRGNGRIATAAEQVDPTSLDFAPYRANRWAAERVEKLARGPLFVDRMLKGFSPEDALAAVHKYHFDYGDLAKWEMGWGRRIIPFYTWTRKNLPLQLEGMVSKPGAYTAYVHAKQNIELGQDEDEFVPEYMRKAMAIKLPFGSSGEGFYGGAEEGSPYYAMPDLPFIGVDEALNVDTALSSLTPLIKTPMEVYNNRSWFTGSEIEPEWAEAAEVPRAWELMGIPQVLHQLSGLPGVPKVERDENGRYLMGRKAAYMVESAMPALGRARRAAPSEPHLQDRVTTNHLSLVFGVGARTLTPEDIRRERERREEAGEE